MNNTPVRNYINYKMNKYWAYTIPETNNSKKVFEINTYWAKYAISGRLKVGKYIKCIDIGFTQFLRTTIYKF